MKVIGRRIKSKALESIPPIKETSTRVIGWMIS